MIQIKKLKAAGVDDQLIRQLAEAWDAFQAAKNQTIHQTPHIVCTGIYNAGKSTLLNALAGKEIFPTGDIPTTKVIAQAEFGGAVYIDTPGLNAMDEDDQETQAAYESADFILFVANAQNGGISEAEAQWMQKLKARYGGLQQRLIYVLTHCTQVDLEQLAGIREKVLGDFRKVVEFEPDEIFCVDSITYRDGIKQNEPLLIENSGIPELNSCLAERIAGAKKTLRKVHEAELGDLRKNLIKLLENSKEFCRQKTQEISSQKLLTDINNLFSDARKKLTDTLSGRAYVNSYMPSKSGSKSFDGKDRWELKRSAKAHVRSYAKDMLYEADRATDKMIKQAREDYGKAGIDSAYFKKSNTVNRILEELQSALGQRGIYLRDYQEIQIQPDISDFDSAIDSLRNGYWSGDQYFDVFENRIEEREYDHWYQERGLFGSVKWTSRYVIDIDGAVREIYQEIKNTFQHNSENAKDRLDYLCWQPFVKELRAKAIARLEGMHSEAKDNALKAKQSAEKPYQTALAYLDKLKEEVTQ